MSDDTRSNGQSHRKRGRVPARKGCLKSPIPSPGLESAQIRKCVAFGADGTEEVYVADVWDRTPTEPARKLTYKDILELKEIQRSLPRANQLPDLVSGRPASHFLSTVPIGLLPLLPDSDSATSSQNSSTAPSPITSPVTSPPPTPTGLANPNWLAPAPASRFKERAPPAPAPAAAAPQPWHPPHLAHLLPSKPPPQREKPRFAFLPLLETPPSSAPVSPFTSNPSSRSPSPVPSHRDEHEHEHEHETETEQSDTDQSQDPPTPSLTNASLDSSPLSRTSSPSPEPSYFQLPPLRGSSGDDGSGYKPHFGTHQDDDLLSSPDEGGYRSYSHSHSHSQMHSHSHNRHYRDPSPARPPSYALAPLRLGDMGMNPELELTTPRQRQPDKSRSVLLSSATPTPTPRRRNVIEINGVEIDLDDDGEDEGGDDSYGYDFGQTCTPGASSSRGFQSLSSLSLSSSSSSSESFPDSAPTTAPGSPSTPPPRCITPPSEEDVPTIVGSSFRPSTPTLTPTRAGAEAEAGGKALALPPVPNTPAKPIISLHSPVRFQRHRGPRPGAI